MGTKFLPRHHIYKLEGCYLSLCRFPLIAFEEIQNSCMLVQEFSSNIFWYSGSLASFDALLKVLALSVINRAGIPLRATKRRRACRNKETDKHGTSSKWTALVEAQVNKQIYTFSDSCFVAAYRGPAKSTPVWVNGGSSLTRLGGKRVALAAANGLASNLLHVSNVVQHP